MIVEGKETYSFLCPKINLIALNDVKRRGKCSGK